MSARGILQFCENFLAFVPGTQQARELAMANARVGLRPPAPAAARASPGALGEAARAGAFGQAFLQAPAVAAGAPPAALHGGFGEAEHLAGMLMHTSSVAFINRGYDTLLWWRSNATDKTVVSVAYDGCALS